MKKITLFLFFSLLLSQLSFAKKNAVTLNGTDKPHVNGLLNKEDIASTINCATIYSSNVGDEFDIDKINYRVTSTSPQEVEVFDYDKVVDDEDVVIPSSVNYNNVVHAVTSIAINAFASKNIKSVVLPSGLETIGTSAFSYNNLESVNIPNSVTSIGNTAFFNNKLTSITIPNSVTSIGYNAFRNNLLTTINFGTGLTSLSAGLFQGNKLTSITIPNSVTSIGNNVFRDNLLTTINFGTGLTSLSPGLFQGNKLTSITIPDRVTSLGRGTFYDNLLTTINFGTDLTSLPEEAFRFNSLTSIVVPSGMVSLGKNAFADNQLTSVTIPNTVTTLHDYVFAINKITSVTIPSSVVSLADGVFYDNELTTVTCEGTTPPTMSEPSTYDNFGGSTAKPNSRRKFIDLIIPDGTLGAYVENTGAQWTGFKSVSFPDTPPTATNVTFSGTMKEGRTLTGSYTYADDDSDTEAGSTFKWYRSNDGTGAGKTAITGATGLTYELASDDIGKYISFEATPVNANASGNAAESAINSTAVVGETFLSQNDLMVTRVDITNKYYEFINTVELAAGTVIKLTDKGWSLSNAFVISNDQEGILTWTLASTIPAGHVFRVSNFGTPSGASEASATLTQISNSNADLSGQISSILGYTQPSSQSLHSAGEQIFIYQGAASDPHFIFGLNSSSAPVTTGTEAGWNASTEAGNSSRFGSMRPTGTGSQNALTTGTSGSAVAFITDQKDIVAYTGPVTGADKATWVTRILTLSNWGADDTTVTSTITSQLSFEVTTGWTGTTTDWNTASNWNTNAVPTATDDVVISNVTNQPVISSTTGAVANNITIGTGATLIVESGGSLIPDGTVTVNGSLIAKVNAADTKWHLITAPVPGEQYDNAWNTANNVPTNGTNQAVSTYINTSDANGDWVYYQTGAAATTFSPGIGYSVKKSVAGDYSFIGTGFNAAPNSPTITAANIGAASENRWNLVGNSFTAYLDVAAFLTANATPLKDTHESVYIWNANAGTSGAYQPVTTGQLKPGEAFFVNSNVASTSVTFTEAMLGHQISIGERSTASPKITIQLANGLNTKSTEINYVADKTTDLDPRFDIGTFTGQDTSFDIFTHLVSNSNGVNFMRQALPNDNYKSMVIPVGVNAAAGSELTFSAQSMNLPEGINVILEDRNTNTFTSLSQNEVYKVTATNDLDGVGRFYVHTSSSALGVANFNADNVSIYKTDASMLRIVGLEQGTTTVKLFNVLGKQVVSTSFESSGVQDISLPEVAAGIYIVEVQSNTGKLSKKIILE